MLQEFLSQLSRIVRAFQDLIRQFFSTSDAIEHDLSKGWRFHSNRRTAIILVIGLAVGFITYTYGISPPQKFPTNQLVVVEENASLETIAYALHAQGAIQSPFLFRAYALITRTDRSLRAGDYLFKEPVDVFSVARAISVGAFGLEPEKIRIPEGATTRSMAIILKSRLLRFDGEKFLERAQPYEGFLYPDTYFFLPNATEDTVIAAMREAFDAKIQPFEADIASSSVPLRDLIILASIIEKEASKSSDRHMIAGVLYNRLKINMPLQVDVTFLYTLGKNSFQLTRADLRSDNPYNTYVNKGLPPGPIGSPSLDSIHAALYPEKHPYLFYLADNTGVTHFTKTYEEHLAKKRQYLGP
jgi:UPF0755 protein